MQDLVPSEAKGQNAFHGRLAVPQSSTMAADNGNGDPDDGEGDDDDEKEDNDGVGRVDGTGTQAQVDDVDDATTVITAGPSRSGEVEELNERPESPPPTPSVAPKRRFSEIDTHSNSKSLPPSISHPSSLTGSHVSSLGTSESKRGRMTGSIALNHIGQNFAGFNEVYKYGIDKEQERHQARMEERNARLRVSQQLSDRSRQASEQAQQLETYLELEELAVLIEVLEDQNVASTYLSLKADELRKAWIRRKLIARGMTPSFV